MIQSLYAAASGMMAVEDQQAVIANNIANAATPGFKRQNVIQEGFYALLEGELRDPGEFTSDSAPGGGTRVSGVYSDWREGTLSFNGDPFSVALDGPGFFTVETENGDRYTRGGKFVIDADSQLATVEGKKLLAVGGTPINITGSTFEVDEQGEVYVDGSSAGRLQVVEFADARYLSREGDGLYSVTGGMSADPADETRVVGSAVELSNVQMPYEMVQMMAGLRAYGAYQRVINCSDETLSRLIDQVAMPS